MTQHVKIAYCVYLAARIEVYNSCPFSSPVCAPPPPLFPFPSSSPIFPLFIFPLHFPIFFYIVLFTFLFFLFVTPSSPSHPRPAPPPHHTTTTTPPPPCLVHFAFHTNNNKPYSPSIPPPIPLPVVSSGYSACSVLFPRTPLTSPLPTPPPNCLMFALYMLLPLRSCESNEQGRREKKPFLPSHTHARTHAQTDSNPTNNCNRNNNLHCSFSPPEPKKKKKCTTISKDYRRIYICCCCIFCQERGSCPAHGKK